MITHINLIYFIVYLIYFIIIYLFQKIVSYILSIYYTMINNSDVLFSGQLLTSNKLASAMFFKGLFDDVSGTLIILGWLCQFNQSIKSSLLDKWLYLEEMLNGLSVEQYLTFTQRTVHFKSDSLSDHSLKYEYKSGSYETVTDQSGYFKLVIPFDQKCHKISIELNYQVHLIDIIALPKNIICGNNTPRKTIVISDIDDTIKITEVIKRREMLRLTFLHPFKPINQMSDKYTSWIQNNKVDSIYYLSSSPWQLYPHLKSFLQQNNFPHSHNLYLRTFVPEKMDSILSFVLDSFNYKIQSIRNIMQSDYKLILIGDEGERDPEIYNQIANEYPNNISKIFIRMVTDNSLPMEIIKRFDQHNRSMVSVFRDATQLTNLDD